MREILRKQEGRGEKELRNGGKKKGEGRRKLTVDFFLLYSSIYSVQSSIDWIFATHINESRLLQFILLRLVCLGKFPHKEKHHDG